MLGKKMHAAVDICITFFVISRDGVDDHARLLRSCSVVKVDQVLSANVTRQNRKVPADFLHIELCFHNLRARAGGFRWWDFGHGRHPISSQFLTPSLAPPNAASVFTEFAIFSKCS